MTDVAPKRASALQKLRGARDILNIAVDHVERAHVGDAYKRRGVREQAASAIGMAAGMVAEAGALFAIECLRASSEHDAAASMEKMIATIDHIPVCAGAACRKCP